MMSFNNLWEDNTLNCNNSIFANEFTIVGTIDWILNSDVSAIAGSIYKWIDEKIWTDANIWKD